ncbi:MAG: hypothetical protein Aurels2KO_11400 [Aureliella sp.]
MPGQSSQQSQFHRSVWVESTSPLGGNSEDLLGDDTVQFLAECGECLALLERAWPTTQTDGLDGPSQWMGEVLLGRYELASEIGRGSFGVVYSAVDLELGREVAVKLPLRSAHGQHGIQDLPRQEAQALAKLVHPNVLRIYDVGKTEDHPFFIVSQRVKGACLANELPLAEQDAVRTFVKLADALHCAHSSSIIHRDIKPSNILIDERGEPLLVDFGLAIEDGQHSTAPDQAGTLIYMPPEQLDGGCAAIDERSDVYSLGATLYETLTGHAPFVADTKKELVDAIKQGAYQPITNISAPLRGIIQRSMDVDPEQRFQTAADLHIALLGIEPSESAQPKQALAASPTWRKRARAFGWTGVVLCLVTLMAFYLSRPERRVAAELLFDDINVASTPLRARALLSYIQEQRKDLDPNKFPIGDSRTRGQINLYKAQLQNVWLGYNTDLTGLCLAGADMSNVKMPSCLFAGTSFLGARLVGAGMNGGDFVGADFSDADLSFGIFKYSSFDGAVFLNTNLTGADLDSACIAAVEHWQDANLRDARMNGAIVDSLDWIERVGPMLSDPSALDGWRVERIPEGTELGDPRYYQYEYWLRAVD